MQAIRFRVENTNKPNFTVDPVQSVSKPTKARTGPFDLLRNLLNGRLQLPSFASCICHLRLDTG